MQIIADFHLHSKYSRATSPRMNLNGLSYGARIKGLNLLGTGDFTFPKWFKELKEKLKPVENTGLFKYNEIFFTLTAEVATYFTSEGKTKRVHHIVHAPSFEIVEQINEKLKKYGNLSLDGRPILNISAPELVEILMEISKDILIYPAHCLPPEIRVIKDNFSLEKIEDIKIGDRVYTHLGRVKRVIKVFKRKYKGRIYHIIPWYFTIGIKCTPEHPILAVKTFKNCPSTRGLCRKTCRSVNECRRRFFKNYKPEWVMACKLKKGDALLFPRFFKVKDVKRIKTCEEKEIFPKFVKVDKDFCRLIGYYVAEGYTNSRDAIGFTFNRNEKDYIKDIKRIIKNKFGVKAKRGKTKGDIIFYSKPLRRFFERLCYISQPFRASTKCIPSWMLQLPLEKQAEILKGWWRGDKGYTSSLVLANQMKIICIRLGIIPSIYIDTANQHKKRGKHKIGKREIQAKFDNYAFYNLSFFEDSFNLLNDKCFKKFKTSKPTRHGWIDENYVYLPIRKIIYENYDGLVFNLEVEEDNSYVTEFATVHNCWTPWMSCLGSKAGFNSLEECYQEQVKYIYALETGLSSDSLMNWRLSSLDKFTLLSNSDSHSPWPWRLGREANVFELKKFTYWEILDTIKKKDKNKFLFTIEVDPNYGKYHWDGHRKCGISLHPRDAIKLKNICPKCGKKLTIGVLHRVEELADRPEGFIPKDTIPFKTLLPLYEIISFVTGTKQLYSQKIIQEQNKLIENFGNELNILLNVPKEELLKVTSKKIADAIIKVREGKVKYIPGYDGVYGKPIFEEKEYEKINKKELKFFSQKSLTDF